MVRHVLWFSAVLICLSASIAHGSPASVLLFRGANTSLGDRDKEAIAKQTGLTLSKDKTLFVDEVGRTLTVEVRELHLNADKIPEVLVIIGGSTSMFGAAGSGVQLYVKDSKGRYVGNLGFPAADVKVLATRTKGYRDLQILGPGFDCPVWRWNGSTYIFNHTIKCA
jgi:hypothetical protein